MTYDVFHQYTPVKVVGAEKDKSGDDMRLYAPAVFYRGTVEAYTLSDALRAAYSLSTRPMVSANG
jgi:hypothetical protein